MRTPWVLALAGMLTGPPQAAAGCACLCVDGGWRTACSSTEELTAAGDLCHLGRIGAAVCPAPPVDAQQRTYAAPFEGVDNCRDVQVYDPGTGGHVSARVCEMRPSE